MKKLKQRDPHSKESLIKYLQQDTDERLWQAIRNWSGFPFIFAGDGENMRDTFYIEADEDSKRLPA